MPPPQHYVTVSGELIHYRLRRSLRDVVLIQQQKDWQKLLRSGAIRYERDHGATLPPLGKAATLFPVHEKSAVSERLDLH